MGGKHGMHKLRWGKTRHAQIMMGGKHGMHKLWWG